MTTNFITNKETLEAINKENNKSIIESQVNYFHNKFKDEGKYIGKRFIREIIQSQQTRSISVHGGEGKPLEDCKDTHKPLLTSPADTHNKIPQKIEVEKVIE